MASITKNNGENSMAEEESDERDEIAREEETQSELSKGGGGGSGGAVATGAATPGAPGFFHIYKSGQGYWTRMGTVGGAVLLILLIAHFFYTFLPTWSETLRAHPR